VDPLVIEAAPAVPLLFAASVALGVVATLAMDAVVPRLDQGAMPPRIASSVLTGQAPDLAPRRLAAVVHYLAGALTGPLFVWLLLAADVFVGPAAAVVLATLVCYPLMVGFFAGVVLPRARDLSDGRVRTIRRAWAVEAAVYVAVLAPLVAVVGAVL
jgi:hypothetical protein